VIPDWLQRIISREQVDQGVYGSMQVTLIAAESLRDLERIAAETARSESPRDAAARLFGGAR
jgi:hypothetical protein